MRPPALLVAAALLVAPLAGQAEDSRSDQVPAKARVLASRGRALHDVGDYASAIAAFTQAYAMAPSPALLFNLAQAYRLQGNCDDAAVMYRRYLEASPQPDGRAIAEAQLANVERCMRELARLAPVEIAARRRILPLAPVVGSTTLARRSRAADLEKDVGLGLTIGGGVSLAVAAFYAVRAHDAANEVAAAYAKGARWQDVAPIDARGKTASARARLLGAGGALGIAGGLVTYLIGRHSERTPMTVAATARDVKVSMRWAF